MLTYTLTRVHHTWYFSSMPQCQGARVPAKQWAGCEAALPCGIALTFCPGALYPVPAVVLATLSAFFRLSWISIQLHPSSQRSSQVSRDSLRAEGWQHPPLTGGQMLPGHEQTNRHQPNGARAQMAERSLACWRPSHKLAVLNRGPLLAALGQDKVTPVCSPQEL